MSLISRLYDVTEGSVCVGGKDVRTYDMDALRNQVAVVLQKMSCFQEQYLTISDGVMTMLHMKIVLRHVNRHVLMNLSRECLRSMIHG